MSSTNNIQYGLPDPDYPGHRITLYWWTDVRGKLSRPLTENETRELLEASAVFEGKLANMQPEIPLEEPA